MRQLKWHVLAVSGVAFLLSAQSALAALTVGDVLEWAEDNGYVAVHCKELSEEEAVGYDCFTTEGSSVSDRWGTAYPGEHPAGCMEKPTGRTDYSCIPYGD